MKNGTDGMPYGLQAFRNGRTKRCRECRNSAIGNDTMAKPNHSINEFLAEAEDILETANQSLLALESAQAGGGSDPDRVNALFRAVHSFKGLAGMFSLKEPSELSHKLEFLLDELRLGKVDLSRSAIDVLVETVALLGRLVHQAGGKQPFEDIQAALERIDDLIKKKPSASSGRPLSELIGLDRGILQVLTEYEEHRLRECVRERKNLFMLRAEFDLLSFEAGIKDLNELLKKHGEIICTLPTAGGGTGIGFSIVLGTKETAQAVRSAIATPNLKIETISYAEARKADEPRPRVDTTTLKSSSNTVRVDIYKLDSLMNIVGEMHLIKNIVGRIARELRTMHGFMGLSVDLHKAQRGLERRLNELQEGILEVRMVPIGQIFTRLSQVVRMYAREAGKEIDLELRGEETELDKLMIEDLADPLMHLIRNAIDHGIETPDERKRLGKPERGSVKLTAFPKGNHVVITIEDDGAGIDAARIAAKAVEKGILATDHGLDTVHGPQGNPGPYLSSRIHDPRDRDRDIGTRRRHGRGQAQRVQALRHDRYPDRARGRHHVHPHAPHHARHHQSADRRSRRTDLRHTLELGARDPAGHVGADRDRRGAGGDGSAGRYRAPSPDRAAYSISRNSASAISSMSSSSAWPSDGWGSSSTTSGTSRRSSSSPSGNGWRTSRALRGPPNWATAGA